MKRGGRRKGRREDFQMSCRREHGRWIRPARPTLSRASRREQILGERELARVPPPACRLLSECTHRAYGKLVGDALIHQSVLVFLSPLDEFPSELLRELFLHLLKLGYVCSVCRPYQCDDRGLQIVRALFLGCDQTGALMQKLTDKL